ncbi:MAG: S41 family peptidase [Bacteroidaceae bacterium]|nr:S41 family peptidase [Bacteroidaceae bacterium]
MKKMHNKKIILIAAALLLSWPAIQSAGDTGHNFQISKNLDIFHSIFRDVDILYVDTIDAESVIQAGIDAMLGKLDPYTVYYPQDKESDLKMMTTGKYAGIGAIIRQYPSLDYIVIEEPYENMPAAVSGVKAGDRILSIDGENMKGKSSQYVSDHLRGDPATKFVLTVARPGGPDSLSINITRANIALPAVPYYGIWKGVGYIILDSFTENCSRDIRKALIELKEQGAKSIILDLRNNGGGLLNEAIDIVGLFVPKGTTVVQTKGKTRFATSSYETRRDPVDADIPLAILTNGSSASASEIVSGALQDLDRAVVIGSRTFGKGLVQTTRDLPYNGTLKVTTSKYYIPSGRCIQEIDYSHLNADGHAGRIPDSLTHVFHTKAGREVRDGGGIRPDIPCPVDTLPDVLYYLSTNVVLFDFLNDYCINHQNIPSPDQFEVSDSLYNAFVDYVRNSDFKFESRSSKILESLRELAEFEGLLDKSSEEFKSLETKLQYDMDKDLYQFKNDISHLLGSSIATRYHYSRGAIQYNMKSDAVLDSAVSVLADKTRYNRILMRPTGKSK